MRKHIAVNIKLAMNFTAMKNLYRTMKDARPKKRLDDGRYRAGGVIEYTYANYDISAAAAAYEKTSSLLSEAQIALDTVNAVEDIEIDLDLD